MSLNWKKVRKTASCIKSITINVFFVIVCLLWHCCITLKVKFYRKKPKINLNELINDIFVEYFSKYYIHCTILLFLYFMVYVMIEHNDLWKKFQSQAWSLINVPFHRQTVLKYLNCLLSFVGSSHLKVPVNYCHHFASIRRL
jgi:hypothetical protein